MYKLSRIALVGALALAGCAHSFVDAYTPVVDLQGVDLNRYGADLAACRAYAVQEDPATKAVQGAVAGALVGVVLGAALGSGFGEAGRIAAVGAADGAAIGGVGGAASGLRAQQLIVQRCLAGRHYRILY